MVFLALVFLTMVNLILPPCCSGPASPFDPGQHGPSCPSPPSALSWGYPGTPDPPGLGPCPLDPPETVTCDSTTLGASPPGLIILDLIFLVIWFLSPPDSSP